MKSPMVLLLALCYLLSVQWVGAQTAATQVEPLLTGTLGVNVAQPGERVHIGNGNMLLDAVGEVELRFRRSGLPGDPKFHLGRIANGGDGDPGFRILYSDNSTNETPVFVVDKKGIIGSAKSAVGSHFEGWVGNLPYPVFRLSSYPTMQLEFGSGSRETDVILRRVAGGLVILIDGEEVARFTKRTPQHPSTP